MDNVTVGDVCKAEFEKWLTDKKKKSQKNVSKNIEWLRRVSSYKNNISVFEIGEVDNLKRFQKSIMKTIEFKRLPGNDRITCMIAFYFYIAFLLQRTDEQVSDVLTEVVGAQTYVVVAAEKEIQADNNIAEEKVSAAKNLSQVGTNIALFIKKNGLSGCSLRDIQCQTQLKNKTIVNLLADDTNIIEIGKDKYIHRDSIVDFEEAAATIKNILTIQFEQFQGYSSARLLYDAVRIDLSLFLNDNDFDDNVTIYYLAKHLFSKEKYGPQEYVFYGNTHIWLQEPDYPKTVKGLLIHYARMAGNTINLEECETFLKKLGFSAGNTKQLMQITQDSTFLQYDKDEFLLGEKLSINEQWIICVAKSLDDLFADNEFVISRDILDEWYEALPSLPAGLYWTRLLLQEILGHYPEIGYRTIAALAGQTIDTIHAAIVTNDSPVRTFADFVSVFFFQEKLPAQRFTAEEVRLLLRQRGVVEGNELYLSMHKALDDYRFAWDNEHKSVFVNME